MQVLNKIAAAALILSAVTTPAMADGFYGAVDFGQTRAKGACDAVGTGFAGCEDTATAYRIASGYQFTPMWGMEISYGNYGKASLGTNSGAALGDWKMSGIQISATGAFPLGDALALTAKVGGARTDLELTAVPLAASSTKVAFGFGVRYVCSKSVALRAQYESLGVVGDANTGTARVGFLSVGTMFTF